MNDDSSVGLAHPVHRSKVRFTPVSNVSRSRSKLGDPALT
jgi:hypothetical protein